MAILDRSRHYAVISGGVPDDEASFVQDDKRFYADGVEVGTREVVVEVEIEVEVPVVKSKPKLKKAVVEAAPEVVAPEVVAPEVDDLDLV